MVEFADFIEEKSAVSRELYPADFAIVRPRESAFLVPKQFAFQQSSWDSCTVNLNKGAGAPRRTRVNPARQHFFPSPAITLDQHRDVCNSNLLQFLTNATHDRRAAKDRAFWRQLSAREAAFDPGCILVGNFRRHDIPWEPTQRECTQIAKAGPGNVANLLAYFNFCSAPKASIFM